MRKVLWLLGLVALIAAGVVVWLTSEVGSRVVASCELRGSGLVNCTVTNSGWAPASGSVFVVLTVQKDPRPNAGTIRVGRVWPWQTVEIVDAAPFIRSPSDFCGAPSVAAGVSDWRDQCRFTAEFR